MKKALFGSMLVLFSLSVFSQKIYFIYIQADNNQPFFLRMNEKVYNSTPAGYLILSKLIDSTYNYEIGFPGKDLGLAFTTTISKKDHGYLLKNMSDRGWVLFDLQTQEIQTPTNKKTAMEENLVPDSTVNAFTLLLSRAADDPSLKFSPAVSKEEKKPEPIQSVVIETKMDTTINHSIAENKIDSAKIVEQKPPESKPIVVKQQPYKRSEVTRISENNVADGVEIVFADRQSDRTDTITIVVDRPKPVEVKPEEKAVETKPDKKFLDISSDSTKTNIQQAPAKKEDATVVDKVKKLFRGNKTPKAGCEPADDNDFFRLRRRMAGRTNDDGMVEEANQYFKSKCFSTEQIRNLSTMFLSAAGKFHFFEAAYNYTSNKENFATLESELKDEFYIAKFKALLHN